MAWKFETEGRLLFWTIIILVEVSRRQTSSVDGACVIPPHFHGDYFSMEMGDDVNTIINSKMLTNRKFDGECLDRWDDNTTLDAFGRHSSKLLFKEKTSSCYRCYEMIYRSLNIIQYKYSHCQAMTEQPTLDYVCDQIISTTDMQTFFRITVATVNCKNTFEGVFHFTYEMDVGGGGICNSEHSMIVACQEPGSPYVDNQVFTMNFGKCPAVSTSNIRNIRFQCMGTWQDLDGNVWSAVADLGEDVHRERFRCMLTRFDEEQRDNKRKYSLSWWADCSALKSPYDGPVRLELEPAIGGYQKQYTQPHCNFPKENAGHWYHMGDNDVNVDINATHIYFKSKIDQYNYKESYFVCYMNSGTRYLTVAITVGKCEIDLVCYDMLPRHHSIIRWRMGKPYRITKVEMSYPNFEMYMFRQACTWNAFTIDRKIINWNYKTFLLNPPAPIPCPIRGRYSFAQSGAKTELYQTRFRGITERPRHLIDCREYTSELKACDENPTIIKIDAEYCNTVDHTGHPIGEYDIDDWQLTCVGYWDEDWKSYLITWDPEDATSPYRCWNYERLDWRHIRMSRSTSAFCRPTQTSSSFDPADGGSLSLVLTETERQYDDCPLKYNDGINPWLEDSWDELDFRSTKSGSVETGCHPVTYLIYIVAMLAATQLTDFIDVGV